MHVCPQAVVEEIACSVLYVLRLEASEDEIR